jgi:hypothetical protein
MIFLCNMEHFLCIGSWRFKYISTFFTTLAKPNQIYLQFYFDETKLFTTTTMVESANVLEYI